jgi:hypothetical protein
LVGTLVGVLPGIGPALTIALLLPLTFKVPATAIFVINHAGARYDDSIPSIKDNLTSLLTQKGFSIVRTENALLPAGLPDSNENKNVPIVSGHFLL